VGRQLLIVATKLAINALALLVVDAMFAGVELRDTQTMIAAAVVLALVNSFLRPAVMILTLPINVLTLGLFTFVINALILMFVSWLIPSFYIATFWTALGAAVVMSIVSFCLNWFLQPRNVRVHVQRG
jgi:putative membrane protein